MKRTTMKQLEMRNILRIQKKNKSYKTETMQAIMGNQRKNHFYLNAISSVQIATFLIEDLLLNIEPQLKIIDQQESIKDWTTKISFLEDSLHKMLNPLDDINQQSSFKIRNQEESNGFQNDYQIKFIQNNKHLKKIPLHHKSNIQSKHSIGQSYERNENLSMKHLTKLTRDNAFIHIQSIDKRKSIEMLRYEQEEVIDHTEAILRDKKTATESTIQNKAYYRQSMFQNSMNKINRSKKATILSSMEQYSYDYEGQVFPLKKYTKLNPTGLKVLNTICKINNKDSLQPKKYKISKLNYELKKQFDQNLLEMNRLQSNIQDIAKGRRNYYADSIFQDNYDGGEYDETMIAFKIEKAVNNKSIRIREITI